MANPHQIKESFLQLHTDRDSVIEHFDTNFISWMQLIPPPIHDIISRLLPNFYYYSHKEINELLVTLHTKLNKDYHIKDHNILHTYIKKESGKINSSIDYFSEYKRQNTIHPNLASDDLSRIPPNVWAQIQNILIIDDCCGTGSSLEKFLEESDVDFSGKTLYYLVIHSMEDSLTLLNTLELQFNIKINLLSINHKGKAFNLINATSSEKDIFITTCKSIGIKSNTILGWKKSEALIAFYNNTPNNTLGLFWQNIFDVSAPFPRRKHIHPAWEQPLTPSSMQELKKARTKSNYESKKPTQKE